MSVSKKAARDKKDAARFMENLAVERPGTKRPEIKQTAIESKQSAKKLKQQGLELSDIFYVDPRRLKPNPLNEYPPLEDEELAELSADIAEKGVLVPLLARTDDVLICGHNRRVAAIKAGKDLVPLQRVIGNLSPELQRDIMKSENDRRRGGAWSKDKKVQFITENFGEDIEQAKHGGARRGKDQPSLKVENNGGDIAKKIEKKSRGKITEGTAARLVSEIRKKKVKKKAANKKKSQGMPGPHTASEGIVDLFRAINCLHCKYGPRRDPKKKNKTCYDLVSPLRGQVVGADTLCAQFSPLTGGDEQMLLTAARPIRSIIGAPVTVKRSKKKSGKR